VIGPNAAVPRLGAYAGEPPVATSLLDGLRQATAGRVALRHAQGVCITEGDDWWADEVRATPHAVNLALIDEAVAVAAAADVVIVAVGDDERSCREAWAAHHLGDRSRLDLVGEQGLLLERLHATGRPLVVVLIGGRPVASEALVAQAGALLQAWTLGEQGGLALAQVITGAVNPAARLAVTVPRHVGQLPVHHNHKPSARRGYLFDDIAPLFPFGFGLSYTRFEIGPPRLAHDCIAVGEAARLLVAVRNVGDRDGDEVVQVYVRDLVASVTRPVKSLCAFERVALRAGESRELAFDIAPAALALWNPAMQRVVEPGEFELLVGPDSQRLQAVRLRVVAAG
jgi:beta-glucosidase